MKNLALDGDRFSRDLLQSFMGVSGGRGSESEKAAEDGGEVELNLGLSLGGRFGVDKSPNKLVRSSSITTSLPITMLEDEAAAPAPSPVAYSSLIRTSSLPVETEEEWRKRKELQSMRRMEAKRRRSEKQRNSRVYKDDDGGSRGCSNADEQYLAAAKNYYGGGSGVGEISKGRKNYHSTRGSLESRRGSCSSMSEFESKLILGSDELSPRSIQSLQEGRAQEAAGSSTTTKATGNEETETSSNKLALASLQAREVGTTTATAAMEDMPCVFTKGDGPSGRRIDGILYKYGKGEEVRIMCVCHGTFLSPSEFVTHAGGSDVAHPLKHIVINRNSSSLQ
ncbi:hypothetical protein DM860_002312 [Cuscuta australis]|uniref:Ninja-family protein n=1 Tax=Cuscuta australis TaxID=267555 RepID=A0A328CYH7_9ASTE|nr:hypothetical protein DM860_002312 [Cuscuta australis]